MDTDEDIQWFNPASGNPDWNGPDRTLGCRILAPAEEAWPPYALCLLFNAGVLDVAFRLPSAPAGKRWGVAVDTAQPSPLNVREPGQELMLDQQDRYLLRGRSLTVLVSR